MATMLSAVVKLSVQGTLLLVKWMRICAMAMVSSVITARIGRYSRRGVFVTGSSSVFPVCLFLRRHQ
ncbi:hypothetical protein EVA_07597 [gut metagenome]|uniref:Uncharacterized protein n=1 Tax=gut metagenome TaxID=749906 RepID=J9GBR7_9ZZZZ